LLLRDEEEEESGSEAGTSESGKEGSGPLSIVLEPTRELAHQVADEARKIGEDGQWRVAAAGDDAKTMASSGQSVWPLR
jgi:superfamily II DNA/RNA helicase